MSRVYRVVREETYSLRDYRTIAYTIGGIESRQDALDNYSEGDEEELAQEYGDSDYVDGETRECKMLSATCDQCDAPLKPLPAEDAPDICASCACGIEGCLEVKGECPLHDEGIGPDTEPAQ